ncbi:MAG: Uma2 family endonuclease [Chloroflexi bacterium]|nr:Uma2 family endonuclease [Chloroflexota bacterium]MBV9603405.1 Uma2 family endonuclease [Chloroflexota bacterium]
MAVPQLELEKSPPLSVEDFLELADQLGWDEDTRVELLDGEIVWMSPIGDPHAACVGRLNELFRRYPTEAALVWPQNPVRVSQIDLPQPDLTLLKPRADYYASSTPRPEDVLLLVEVADTTVRTDLGRKARIYATAGVREYWVIDLNSRSVYSHGEPTGGDYAVRTVLRGSDRLSAQFAVEVSFTLEEILG